MKRLILLTFIGIITTSFIFVKDVKAKPYGGEKSLCPSYNLCLFEDYDFKGKSFNRLFRPGECIDIPDNFKASSIINNSGYVFTVHRIDKKCPKDGDTEPLLPFRSGNLSNTTYAGLPLKWFVWNDNVGSIRREWNGCSSRSCFH